MVNAASYFDSRDDVGDESLNSQLSQLKAFHQKKLWHQLTTLLLETVQNDYFNKDSQMQELYDQFISTFEMKINPVSLAKLVLKVANNISDPEALIVFLETISKKLEKEPAGYVLVQMRIAHVKLGLKDLAGCKEILDSNRTLIEDDAAIILSSHATFYELSAAYQKEKGNFSEYYRDALRFLGCTEVSAMDLLTQQRYAIDLSLAALVAENVYNFGELIIHPILESIKESEHAWLYQLIHAFNSGDIKAYDDLQPKWQQQNELVNNVHSIRQKIQLMTLLEMVFERPTHDRCLPFDVIASKTYVKVNEVEKLVMRALSLNLIKGTIDEITNTVSVNWVQPRVLDRNQISLIVAQLGDWCAKVGDTVSFSSEANNNTQTDCKE